MSSLRVGFIGLGHMGGPMARNLQAAGYDLVVHDLRRQAAESLEAGGAKWASSPAEVGAAGCDVVLTSLPAPPDVEDVLLGCGRCSTSSATRSGSSTAAGTAPAIRSSSCSTSSGSLSSS